MNSTQQVKEFLTGLQERIVERLEEVDGKHFRRDKWERPEGGGGLSCVMEGGNVFERGGVNYSHVFRRWAAPIRHSSPARVIGTLVRGNGGIDRASPAQPVCAHRPFERSLPRSPQGRCRAGVVVWRRHGSDALLWL